jgi:hypothetical protein
MDQYMLSDGAPVCSAECKLVTALRKNTLCRSTGCGGTELMLEPVEMR